MHALEARAKELQSTIYVTLGGVVQSLAFYFLLSALVHDDAPRLLAWQRETALFWLRFFIAGQVIVLVWHEYAVGVIFFRWVWTYTDSAIPFILGLMEFILINQIVHSSYAGWFAAMGGMALGGYFSYWNQYKKAGRDPENDPIMRNIGSRRRLSLHSTLTMGLVFFGVAWFTSGVEVSYEVNLASLILLNFLTIGVWQYARATLAAAWKPPPVQDDRAQAVVEPCALS